MIALSVAVPIPCIVVLAIKLLTSAAPVTFKVDVVLLLLTIKLSSWLNDLLLNVLVVVLLLLISAFKVAVPADCMMPLLVIDPATIPVAACIVLLL